MTSTNTAEILETLVALMGRRNVVERVDRPVDEALAAFVIRYDSPLRAGGAVTAWGTLLASFYERLSGGTASINQIRAEEEAIALAEDSYSGKCGSGYVAAIRDSLEDPPVGIAHVLAQFAETVKRVERAKYIRWALISAIDPADRYLRARLARAALEKVEQAAGTPSPPLTDGEIAQSCWTVVQHCVRAFDEG